MPNPFDDYINSLEGKTDVDPLAVVRDLRELHTQEIGTREAKISELDSFIAKRDETIADQANEITKQKSKNFDLAMQIPSVTDTQQQNQNNNSDEKPPGGAIKISDLFKPEVRKRHGL